MMKSHLDRSRAILPHAIEPLPEGIVTKDQLSVKKELYTEFDDLAH